MRNKALVVGSIGFDVIFGIHGDIRDEIPLKDGKLGNVNLMFTARNKEVYYGGTAGNISYGLGLLGKKPYVFSVVGEDFYTDYEQHLKKLGAQLRLHSAGNDSYTATFYGISDEEYQQIGIWQPNAYGDLIEETPLKKTLSDNDFNQVKIAIFSPGTGLSTGNHMLETYKKTEGEATMIFDPSQVLSIFYDKTLLKECLSLADIVISNETEIAQFETLFQMTKKKIFSLGVEYIIETKGKDGAKLYSDKKEFEIDSHKPKNIVETTGAGDAFRAGLISGLLEEKPIEKACEEGAKLGSLSVEEYGGQGYKLE